MTKGAKLQKVPRVAKVAFAVPSGDSWKADMAICMMQLTAVASQCPKGYDGLDIMILNSKGSILPKQRYHLVETALKGGATHILFIDSDQTFPSWMLHKMLEENKQVIACNISTKSFPANPTARNKSDSVEGELVFTTEEKVKNNVVEKVWRVGTGIMLIETSVFQELTAPYFEGYYNRVHGEWVGEDWAFCEALEKAGIPIYIDHVVSSQVGHIGSYSYSQIDVLSSHQPNSIQLQTENDGKLQVGT